MDTAAAPSAPISAFLPAPRSAARPRITHPARLFAAALALAALVLLAWRAMAPPPAPAPLAEVLAPAWMARSQSHADLLAAAPRPIATEGNAQARAYLVAQLRALGLAPTVQRTTVRKSVVHYFGPIHHTIGVVHNVVAVIPGSAPDAGKRPALLLATHYDSGAAMPAPTHGAAVAALLETARALRAAPPQNDVVLLLADGEHVGALGAKGFVEQHPLARRIALALKFDSGAGGALRMAAASGAGSAALDGWMRAAPALPGSSFEATLAEWLPGTPRIGHLAGLDAPVLLFAGEAPLPQWGDATLRLARAYADGPPARRTGLAQAWFTLPLAGPVRHGAWVNWILAALSCAALALGWRRLAGQDGTTEAVKGIFGVAFLLLAIRIGSWNWREELAGAGVAGEPRLPLQVMAIAACVFVAGLVLLRRRVGAAATVFGALAWPVLALLPAVFFLPGAAHVLAWPTTAALGAALTLQSRWGEAQRLPLRLLVLAAGLAPAAALLPAALRDSWLLLAPGELYLPPMLLALPVLCFAALLLALGRDMDAALAGLLAIGAAACFALPAQTAPELDARRAPASIERLVYHKDMNTWRAYWLLPPQPLDDWTRLLFAQQKEPDVYMEVFGWHSPRQWHAVAPRDDAIAFPECFILASRVGAVRLGEFTVRSRNRAPHIELSVSGAKVLRSRLDGQVLTSKEGNWWLSLYGMEDRLLHFAIETGPKEIFAVTVQERMPGLPRHLLPPRPDGVPALAPQLGQTVSTDILRFYR